MQRSTQYELVQAHIPFRQVFKLASPKRKIWCDWFTEQMDLRIEVVDPSDAPVAYDVRFGPEDLPRRFGYPIRSYENGLWWSVGGDYNYILHPETFATMLKMGTRKRSFCWTRRSRAPSSNVRCPPFRRTTGTSTTIGTIW